MLDDALPLALRANEQLIEEDFRILLAIANDPNATKGRLKFIPRGIRDRDSQDHPPDNRKFYNHSTLYWILAISASFVASSQLDNNVIAAACWFALAMMIIVISNYMVISKV